MSDLDFLIPDSILALINENQIDLKIGLRPESAKNSWPSVRIFINNQIVKDQLIDQPTVIDHSLSNSNTDALELKIEYYGKTDRDTVTNDLGEIIENQSVTIESFTVNGIDLIKNHAIYRLGHYTKILSETTLQYFKDHGIDYGPSHSLYMSENGHWSLSFRLPITKFLIELIAIKKPHESNLTDSYLLEIHNTVGRIRQLEKRKKFLNIPT